MTGSLRKVPRISGTPGLAVAMVVLGSGVGPGLVPVSSGNISASIGGTPGEEVGGLPGGKTSIGGSGESSEPGVS